MLDDLKLAPKDEDEMEDFRDYDDEGDDMDSKLDDFDDDDDDDDEDETVVVARYHAGSGHIEVITETVVTEARCRSAPRLSPRASPRRASRAAEATKATRPKAVENGSGQKGAAAPWRGCSRR